MTVKRHEEYQYLDLIRAILDRGEHRPDRTGTGTLSLFGPPQLRFSLRNETFPLLTTKKVFTKAIFHELLWFVKGSTNGNELSDVGVKIWEGNGSREYLDSIGLHERNAGDLGPVYGFQWRHFGAEYKDCHTDYTGQGIDQLSDCIRKLKSSPYDRRIIMSAWNPADLSKMALPPCHMFCQFYVSYPNAPRDNAYSVENRGRGELSCLLYQRSCDMGLGVPFNIASYALLTRMVAEVADLDAGELIHTMGDAHVYKDHIDALRVQLEREPKDFPKLRIARPPDGTPRTIDDFKYEDLIVEGYQSWPAVKMKMSV
ncbi:Thymidylate synthase [Taphrina deformans PYCC 5710]|uniref:thymidylate synthase n=1 Tax=Taphrina deformans (strain PYCC 5710 / ATCC 11124 / CBS 356.35 / IMI 108563 / JCM 9778 / NBRC 8474) TaxID=1097556 RepID=R4X6X0_TAPDE|nr:Thymidylate synthase [Taphrina deformans PYCC 5710]|eukprot:CCG80972.1 Thymidylate synthase [Taphrina deformans PYCC 5710]